MAKFIEVFGIKIEAYTVRENMQFLEEFVTTDDLNIVSVVSSYMLMAASGDKELSDFIKSTDLRVIADPVIFEVAEERFEQQYGQVKKQELEEQFLRCLIRKKKKVFYQLQGYIYPDTYYLSKDITGDQLVAKMLDEFDKKFDQTRQEKAKKLGMTVEEVLIRASLLQKETELPEEYPIIAGVIQNRLDKKMKLQFDSTAVYAITKGQYGIARVMYKDLKVDSPYNTYKHKGLPVGPICSPSLEAIDGVLNPQKNDYLYFQMDTVKNDGSNIFSKTYEEHKAASATTEAAAETTTTAAKQKTKKK